ncbi:MAG TPA: cupin domain-containing protein [Actinophytocola sp.]|uniref:cupin domain-containing protein n=1 Tax=Actinophytocola sp. TaxID=1872138 RepID=UPI002DF73637|nr:cupin domain-containing protein [Actinophytocola sp.]
MSYLGSTGEISAIWRPEVDVETLKIRTTTARFVATGSVTNGQFGLYRWDMVAGTGGSGAHFHKTFSESFYVVSGKVGLYNGDKWIEANPGDFLYIPEGGIHGFRNDSDGDSSMIILFAPAPPRELYFRALAEIADSGRTLTDEEWTELYAEHDQYMV